MTLEQMLKLIALKCGNREMEEMEEFALPYFALKQAELEADPFLPWFLKKEEALTVVDGEVQLPLDFIKLDHSSGIWYTDGNGSLVELCMLDLKGAMERYGTQSGSPTTAVLKTSTMALYPFVEEGLVTISYYAKASPLELAADSNVWSEEAPWYLLSMVGVEVAQDLEHGPGVKFFTEKAEGGREMLYRMDAERSISGQRLTW